LTTPYILGICGGSASGKTFLLRQLMSTFTSQQVSLISQDNYYRPLEQLTPEPDGLVNFDHPDTVDLDRLVGDLRRLQAGEAITMEEYTFNNPNKVPKQIRIEPAPLVIVEGLFVFHHRELAQQLDLRVFVDARAHVRLSRRLKRDTSERGYSMESILRDYERFVAPMYERYVLPTREDADMVIPNHKHMYKAVQVLVNHLRATIHA
jgi:uridine kinase